MIGSALALHPAVPLEQEEKRVVPRQAASTGSQCLVDPQPGLAGISHRPAFGSRIHSEEGMVRVCPDQDLRFSQEGEFPLVAPVSTTSQLLGKRAAAADP